MAGISSPESAILGVASGSHGFDDIGALQATGTVSSAANAGGRFAGKAALTMSAPHGLKVGMPINIAGTTDYNGVTRVLKVISSTRIVINKAYVSSQAGTWNLLGGDSAWVAFMPVGADLPAASISALTLWYPNAQGGSQLVGTYTKDVMYMFPGIIKTILLTSGNIRLFRHSTLNPGGK
jgi:hypothetical protein